jgi:hypothetical protein
MFYEGFVNIQNDTVNVRLEPEETDNSSYDITMDNNVDTLEKFMTVLEPEFTPDEEPETPKSYAASLQKQGSGSFITSDTNINDLVNMYAQTKPKEQTPFPGLEMPRQSNEIIFIETVHNFNGIINNKLIENRTVEFRYRGRL